MLGQQRNRARGFSLLEVLVALVVLSIGLMGIASMQVLGLQFNQQAMTTTRAVELAADMADRIRANANATANAAVPGQAYQVEFGANPVPATTCADLPGNNLAGIAACNNVALAANDIWQWKNSLTAATGSGLAEGDGAITHTYDNARRTSTYIIDVRWSERGEQAHYVLELRL